MKVIDKSNREILLEFLKLPDDIREYDINKQYTILHDKIEVLEKSIFLDFPMENDPSFLLQCERNNSREYTISS